MDYSLILRPDLQDLLNKYTEMRDDEINHLRAQIVQLRDNHKQQLMLQDKYHKDGISKYKYLLENIHAESLPEQNVIRKDKRKNIKKHPALINEENTKQKERLHDELLDLEVDKVILRKRRKLFQDNKEVIDII
ncbi:PREDICTED: uncharacterized protein LOC105460508 isoform X2 [Wasmannia auropunctata]|uniref:uncharacterized protein LOC105460508 isoform X2 n=1 Tax=Wasmannia auropunctata TaxID=64793 RepID=UPI0005EF9CD0|nr:PREDICTED: uncharacterized protein LOC105460508 isoform X2 [Wasmannia auropunctata]